ncbi:DUF6252 family protein [Flavobacterium sp. 3HN19-14]|uniref:DUF6252 family protein n=1 Tax=Flavobacterium sp. 3HN19-14 TaxID=3448133 RepID=UPI003EE39EF4
MKTILSITRMSFLALAFMVISCSGSDDDGGGGTAANGTITAKIGGSGFTSMAAATTAVKVANGNAFTISLSGTNSGGKNLNIVMNGIGATTGTYEIGGDNLIAIVASYTEVNLSNPMATKIYAAPWDGGGVAGSVTITEITDTKIVGNFHFTSKNQSDQSDVKEITNGGFNINFQN